MAYCNLCIYSNGAVALHTDTSMQFSVPYNYTIDIPIFNCFNDNSCTASISAHKCPI